jgi:hypothetical protein
MNEINIQLIQSSDVIFKCDEEFCIELNANLRINAVLS